MTTFSAPDDLVQTALVEELPAEKDSNSFRMSYQSLQELTSSPDACSDNKETYDEVCEECRNLVFPSPVWRIKDIRSHKCALSRALIDMHEDSRNKNGGMFRYIPIRRRPLKDVTQLNEIVYFNIGRPGSFMSGALRPEIRSLWPMRDERYSTSRDILRPDQADLSHARSWLNICHEEDIRICRNFPKDIFPGLKVIDCHTKQVCIAIPNQRYATLSYVWGVQSSETSATSNSPTSFPKTVEDALVVSRELGIPYLWVDRYCIDQTNQQERHNMIANMDSIYANSEVTIVAAAGSNPHHGLPGVSGTPRRGTHRVKCSHGDLDYFADPYQEVKGSAWNQRAWTFQEMLLSPRRLAFTESQMVFECCSRGFRESINMPCRQDTALTARFDIETIDIETMLDKQDYEPLSDFPCYVFPENGIGRCPEDIHDRIEEYSGKHLSYPSDRLHAIEGIFNAFRSRVSGYLHHFWGIPIMENEVASFLTGLYWRPSGLRRAFKQKQWPTWSWASTNDWVQFWTSAAHWPNFESRVTCVTVTHLDGRQESLYQFARGSQGYEEYQPWIEISTWVDMRSHFADIQMDDTQRSPEESFTALYLLQEFSRVHFLLTQEMQDGSFQRVGTAFLDTSPEQNWNPSEIWEFRKIRLV